MKYYDRKDKVERPAMQDNASAVLLFERFIKYNLEEKKYRY